MLCNWVAYQRFDSCVSVLNVFAVLWISCSGAAAINETTTTVCPTLEDI